MGIGGKTYILSNFIVAKIGPMSNEHILKLLLVVNEISMSVCYLHENGHP